LATDVTIVKVFVISPAASEGVRVAVTVIVLNPDAEQYADEEYGYAVDVFTGVGLVLTQVSLWVVHSPSAHLTTSTG
jgi:hypothetical protein